MKNRVIKYIEEAPKMTREIGHRKANWEVVEKFTKLELI